MSAAMTRASNTQVKYEYSDRRDRNLKAQGLPIDYIYHNMKVPLAYIVEAGSQAAGSDPASQVLATTKRKYDHPSDIAPFGRALAEAMLAMGRAVADGERHPSTKTNTTLPSSAFLSAAAKEVGVSLDVAPKVPQPLRSDDVESESEGRDEEEEVEPPLPNAGAGAKDEAQPAADDDILKELAARKVRNDEIALSRTLDGIGANLGADEYEGDAEEADAYRAAQLKQLGTVEEEPTSLEKQILDREREMETAKQDRKDAMQQAVESEAASWVKNVRLLDNEDFRIRKWAPSDVIEQLVAPPDKVTELARKAMPSNQDRVKAAKAKPNARARKVQALLDSLSEDAVRFVVVDKKHAWAKDERWKERIVEMISLPESTMDERFNKLRLLMQLEDDMKSSEKWYEKLQASALGTGAGTMLDANAKLAEEDRLDDEIIAHYEKQIRDIQVKMSARDQLRIAIQRKAREEQEKMKGADDPSALKRAGASGTSRVFYIAAVIVALAVLLYTSLRNRGRRAASECREPANGCAAPPKGKNFETDVALRRVCRTTYPGQRKAVVVYFQKLLLFYFIYCNYMFI